MELYVKSACTKTVTTWFGVLQMSLQALSGALVSRGGGLRVMRVHFGTCGMSPCGA